jgi:hypothetical protein
MHSRLAALKRLMSLYGGIEEMHSVGLQRTMAAVREAEQAIDVQQETVRSSNSHGRDALMTGDRMEWAAARTQREIAEWKQERLQQVRLEREKLNDEARRQYIASRLQSEQMKHVVDSAATQVEVEAGRRMQAALDDRFLARRRWTDAREESRTEAEINAS